MAQRKKNNLQPRPIIATFADGSVRVIDNVIGALIEPANILRYSTEFGSFTISGVTEYQFETNRKASVLRAFHPLVGAKNYMNVNSFKLAVEFNRSGIPATSPLYAVWNSVPSVQNISAIAKGKREPAQNGWEFQLVSVYSNN